MTQKMKLLSLVSLFAVISLFSCNKGGGSNNTGGGPTGGNPTLNISGNSFSPGTLTVKVGTTINIVNNDPMTHSATADNGTTFDKDVPAGSTVTLVCNTVGNFPYHCKYHVGMNGTLVVTP